MQNLDTKPNLDWMDEPIKADRWKAMMFLTGGRSIVGQHFYASEERVFEAEREWKADTERKMGMRDDIWCSHPDGQFWYSEYSHCIAIPIKEG